MMKRLSMLPQYLAPQRMLTHFAGWLSERRSLWFKNWQISYLIKHYGADIHEAVDNNLADYPTFNSFFTRKLKPELRPIVEAANEIACPADGTVSQAGQIENHLLFQAKGFHYTLERLLGGSKLLADTFQNGTFATVYLSPKDYHRVHMPITGKLSETIFIPGKLFSVNTKTARAVPNLFARNERLVSIFDTELGPMAVILVGAMLVGSINTVWRGEIKSGKILRQTFSGTDEQLVTLDRGCELGHFKMGSTVIVLFAQDKMQLAKNIREGENVKMGQLFGTYLSS